MNNIKMIKTNFKDHVSMDLYHEFEGKLLRQWPAVEGINSLQAKILRRISKFLPPLTLPIKNNNIYVAIGLQEEKLIPYFLLQSKLRVVLMYDAWEPLFKEIADKILKYKINILFTSSKQASDHFSNLSIPNFRSFWIPEAVDVANTNLFHIKTEPQT